MEAPVVKAEERPGLGKGASTRLRRRGYVPAIVYGEKTANLPVAIPEGELRRISLGTGQIFRLEVAGDKQFSVLVRDLQKEAVSQKVIHLDLMEVSMTEKLVTVVPVRTTGQAKGEKEGGLLQYGIREVEIECLPGDIPPGITVDVSLLEIGDSIQVKDLDVPAGVVILTDPEKPVVNVVPAQSGPVEETEETGEEGQETETENGDSE